MMKIIIFGTGSSAEKFLSSIDESKVQIVAFSDNNKEKHYTTFNGYNIIPPDRILEQTYEYIFIASQYSDEIMTQLVRLGISYSIIIPTDFEQHNKLIKVALQSIKRRKVLSNKQLKIALINYNYSNYNGYALYKYIPDYIKEKYEVDLIQEKNIGNLATYDVICSSHYDGIYDENHINIEMWHGFPLKRIGLMDKLNTQINYLNDLRTDVQNTDLVLSYSQFYTTLFNASFPSDINKYRITGMPRNDLLFEDGSRKKLEEITKKELRRDKVVFYLPTWRKGKDQKRIDSSKIWNTLFGFADENSNSLIKLIEKENIFLVIKLHPFEFNKYKDLSIFKHDQIYLLSDEELKKHQIHLYELLNASETLITDYSSVYFDTLLIDLPIIFTQIDLEEYKRKKGFLIEPHNYLMPGAIVSSLKELQSELRKVLRGYDLYSEERRKIRNVVFKHFDNKSSERAWHEINEYLQTQIVKCL